MAISPEVTLSISAEWSKLNSALNDASRRINSWAVESGNAFKNFEKSVLSFTTRVAAIAAPFVAVGAALGAMAQKTANAGDEILKMGQKIGVPVEKLSALKYAAQLSNVSIDELGTYLGHFSKTVTEASQGTGEASNIFRALGINVKDVSGKIKPTESLLLELANKFSTMEDSAGKTAIAMVLFGRSGKEIIPFLNQGREGIKELMDEAERMGLVFSKDSAEAANRFNDNITKIKEQLNALVYAIGNQLIPAFNQLIGSGDGVLKVGYAIGGIFQGAASSALFLSAGIFKVISGLALLTDKLGITTNQYTKWKEESTLALEASIDLAKQAQGNILDLFIPSSASASTGDNRSIKKSATPEIIDTKKRETEIATFLKKSEDETKRHLERLSAMREKQADENLEIEKKSHSEMWGVIQEYNKKMAEADKAGLIDRTEIYRWYYLQVGEIRKKEMQTELDEGAKKNSFIVGLQNQILSAQKELYGEEWSIVQEYYQKKEEAAKYGAEAELELEKWLVAEIEAVRGKIKPIEPPKKWYEGMKDFTSVLSAISSGSLSQMAGIFGEGGKKAGGIIELISNIGKLPDLLKASIKGLVEGIRDLGKSIVTIIKDIVVNLPQILVDVVATVISETIPTLLRELPNMVLKMLSNIWEAIKTLIFGGEIKSTIDGWTQEASNQTVTVNLDTSAAMNALKQAQEALLGAVNETDRKVAREALLSARQAAILAEKQKQQTGSQTSEIKRFEGLFGMIENIFKNLWKGLEDIFGNAWVGLAAVFTGAVIVWKTAATIWSGIHWVAGKVWTAIHWAAGYVWSAAVWVAGGIWSVLHWAAGAVWTALHWVAGGVWTAIHWAAGYVWSAAVWVAGGIWSVLHWAAGEIWTGIHWAAAYVWSALNKAWDLEWLGLKKIADLEFIAAFSVAGVALVAAFIGAIILFKNETEKIFKDFLKGLGKLFGSVGEQTIDTIGQTRMHSITERLRDASTFEEAKQAAISEGWTITNEEEFKKTWEFLRAQRVLGNAATLEEAKQIAITQGWQDWVTNNPDDFKRTWESIRAQGIRTYHLGGFIKAHSGMYLKDDEVSAILQVGEGVLNRYKGMLAVGGEAGLNFANRHGYLPGGNTVQNITQHITQYFEVVTDKDGNVLKLTRTQARNLARTLDPLFKEMKRNNELSFA